MKILITGGTGFIGSYLAGKLPAPIRCTAILLLVTASALSQSAPPEGEKTADIEVGFEQAHLTHGYAPWRSEYMQLVGRLAARKVIYGRFERTRRFSQNDSGITVGGYYPLGERWTALGELYGSPTHKVLASWSGLGQIERDLGSGWTANTGLRYRKYVVTSVKTGNVGVGKSIKRFRVGYTLYASSVEDAGLALTSRVDGTYNYGNSAASLTFAFGKELENIVPSGVLSTRVRLVNFNGSHWFTNSWAASYSLDWHDQGNIYTRQGWTLGLRYRL